MSESSDRLTDIKRRIAAAAGVNDKTVERQSRNLIYLLFGVSDKDLKDPLLREYIRWKLYGDKPEHIQMNDEVV